MNQPPLFTPELLAEFELLARFDLNSLRAGIKLHHDASPELVGAAARLHAKGLITARDGGYLTDLGIEVAEHLDHVLIALRSTIH